VNFGFTRPSCPPHNVGADAELGCPPQATQFVHSSSPAHAPSVGKIHRERWVSALAKRQLKALAGPRVEARKVQVVLWKNMTFVGTWSPFALA
jgi:hypothetical protein